MTATATHNEHKAGLKHADGSWKYTNALAHESSPYLLQHAHNPVDWHAWGPQAFELARQQGKPIFLSIGYSTCYWCHVMERQSFENPAIAAVMNQHFVNIKVDREERPDVDDIYMTAVQIFTGHGGWPMSMFLTAPGTEGKDDPGLKPFYAGTYFPPEPSRGMPGFPQLLENLATAWRDRRREVLQQAEQIVHQVREHLAHRQAEQSVPPIAPGVDAVQNAVHRLLRMYDPDDAGFGGAPKFPQPSNLLFLLRVHQNNPNEELWSAIHRTLDRMARGGMYDQIGGGFHRYSTDEKWLVPHFEKMLYDNGQLAEAYAVAHTLRPPKDDPQFYARVAREVCDYVLREMTDETGAFWSAQDAEVDAREGGNYVWTADEVREALGDAGQTRLALAMYGLDAGPNFRDPHHPDAQPVNVLFLPRLLHELAAEQGVTFDALLAKKAAMDKRLFEVRARRKQPGTDDKVLTSWNGLMIGGMARVGRVLGEPRYVQAAGRAADAVLKHMRGKDGGLLRTMRKGTAKIPAFLEDYACFVHGLIELHRADRQAKWLDAARSLLHVVRDRFATPGGGYFDTLENQADLFVRTRGSYDGAVPSGNSQMVHNLVDMFELTGEQAFIEQAATDLASFADGLRERASAMIHMEHALLRAIEAAPQHFAAAGSQPSKRRQAIGISVEPAEVDLSKPGSAATIRVTIDIHKDYHINAHAVGSAGTTPTQLELAQGGGLQLTPRYPTGVRKHYPFAPEPIDVYEGKLVIETELRRTGNVEAKPILMLTYQVCTNFTCLEPRTVELPVNIRGNR